MKISIEDYYNIPQVQRNGIYEVENKGTIYYVNGKIHREDGSGREYIDGHKEWWVNDKYHRLDGPAVEWNDGHVEYWIEDKQYDTKEEFETAAYIYKNGLQDYL